MRLASIRWRGARGQAAIVLVAGLVAILLGAVVLGAVARAVGREGADQRTADLAALAGARAMHAAYPRLFEPATLDGQPNPRHLEVPGYLELGRTAADETARRNGAAAATISFPDAESFAPVRIRVGVRDTAEVRSGGVRRHVKITASAVAELAPPGADGISAFGSGSGYDGPVAHRQGKPCPHF